MQLKNVADWNEYAIIKNQQKGFVKSEDDNMGIPTKTEVKEEEVEGTVIRANSKVEDIIPLVSDEDRPIVWKNNVIAYL